MSEEPATVEKNFRSSYYKSLGFRSEEKNLSQLEGLIRADKIGRRKSDRDNLAVITSEFLW